jgi:hypothetical protein
MGWLLNAGLFMLLLLAVAYSAWAVALLIAVYFALKLRGLGGGRRHPREEGEGRRSMLRRVQRSRLAGSLLLVMALVALAEGGTYSVLLFVSLAMLAFFHRSIACSSLFSRVVPVAGSILVRRSVLPFMWVAVAEVKQSRGTLTSLLSGIQDTIVVRSCERAAVYLALEHSSLFRFGAESALLGRMRRLSSALAPLGAYLLPLDSAQVCERFSLRFEREKVEEEDWPVSLAAAQFDTVVIRARGGFVEAVGAYISVKDTDSPSLPGATQRMKVRPLLVETLEELGRRVTLPGPDAQTSFLASLCSARGEPLGQVLEFVGGEEGSTDTVAVRALSSPSAELSRAQLRAMARIYASAGGGIC